ncbi:MAG: hypothetical protein L7V85_07080 [Bacteroidia bacterium]|nr:hypothetical protein [Bacteroidia bacterium]
MMIKYKDRFTQKLDFTGFSRGKIHPTDIDGIIEIDNKYLIIFEVKKKGMDVPTGQRLLLQRLADCWEKTNGPAFVIYCEHETKTEEIVYLLNTQRVKVYHNRKYYTYEEKDYVAVSESIQRIVEQHNITKLKEEQ